MSSLFDCTLRILHVSQEHLCNIDVVYRFVGNLLKGQTLGIIGAGRIGTAYARMMVPFSPELSTLMPSLYVLDWLNVHVHGMPIMFWVETVG
jgi:hypothetical protein